LKYHFGVKKGVGSMKLEETERALWEAMEGSKDIGGTDTNDEVPKESGDVLVPAIPPLPPPTEIAPIKMPDYLI
jgi:hypothetical protein